jgi:hypothetical protein
VAVVRSEEELYPLVMSALLAGRGRVLIGERVGGMLPDFVVDGGVWRVIVEVKTRVSPSSLGQLARYSRHGETCIALPLNARPGPWDGCVVYIDAVFLPARAGERGERAGEGGKAEVRRRAERVHAAGAGE